ncbi:hypothetical protein [Methylobacterium nodulans]|uniref:Uncharacterized protein n=1 Tax=Methylobacterium nodulans (strain LMG 21967 / CNCM I-2342 / ORS 2060) TaxID=460265 RepID=B8IPI7_METNO|nr:hypothetical protein [Methylobacterium nodulans]ACL62279.1 hypothetical protein Mnod_7543 [Methylobacterium nodulans ORS 2060]
MAKAVSIAGSAIWTLIFPAGLVLLFLLNFGLVNQAFRDLLAMTSRIHSMKTAWVEFTLRDKDHLAVSVSTSDLGGVDAPERQAIVKTVKWLNGLRTQRLFTLEKDDLHCAFTQATAQMRRLAGVDYDLEEAGLITSTYDEAATQAAAGKADPLIGTAQSCYRIRLTPRGYNVKTVLVEVIRNGFEDGVGIEGEKL